MTDHEIHTCIDAKVEASLRSITGLIVEENKLIKHSIDQLTERVGKQNGRVGKSEDRLTLVERTLDAHTGETKGEAKQKERSWARMINVIMAVIAAAALVFTAIKTNSTETMVKNQGIPFIKNSRGEFVALPDSTIIGFFPNDSISYTIIKNKSK